MGQTNRTPLLQPRKMKYQVTYTNRYYPEQGENPVNDISSSVEVAIDQLAANRDNGICDINASRQLALDLIDMLFRRDFSGDGSHWSFDGHSADPMTSDDPQVEIFEASESYEWDWKDIFSVAKSKGIIIINHSTKSILVKDYSFYCSG
jgi:hypothetical protein